MSNHAARHRVLASYVFLTTILYYTMWKHNTWKIDKYRNSEKKGNHLAVDYVEPYFNHDPSMSKYYEIQAHKANACSSIYDQRVH